MLLCLSHFTVNFCIPLITVNVKPGKTFLSMSHMDQSLEKEHGVHIEFNISFWKVVTGGHSEVSCIFYQNKTCVICCFFKQL